MLSDAGGITVAIVSNGAMPILSDGSKTKTSNSAFHPQHTCAATVRLDLTKS